jgi:hypothetical protein
VDSETALVTGESLIAQIVDATKICGGQPPASADEFWRELAMLRNIKPQEDVSQNARLVLESLGEEWDDDYLDEDGRTPTLGALEVVHVALVQGGNALDAQSEREVESEDDEGGFEAEAGEIHIGNVREMSVESAVKYIRENRLILNPEWQRNFVWKLKKQRALIESMLLELPLPSLLLFKDRESGKLFVIDGRQRLETINRFMAPKPLKGEPRICFRTFSAKQEGWRPGQSLNSAANKYYDAMPEKFKTTFDLTPLRIAILDVPRTHLYQIFKRYNTGSVALNAAEIRNAVYQLTPIHEMMFRLGGEYLDATKYQDDDEREVAEDLRDIMKGRKERYGAYDFIGRFFAFSYQSTGSVAKATNNFMDRELKANKGRIEELRREFISAFKSTISWYDHPLTEPKQNGVFHAFLATIQMTSTRQMLFHIKDGKTSEPNVIETIKRDWPAFAEKVLFEKQNSTNFWLFQKQWILALEKTLVSA